ncbi:hypothetical protein Ndes2526B_g02619 [Nannochloris sp. 'desiccata']
MGISRDSLHKRRSTGGKQNPWRKKRKYELGRQPAMTKLSSNVCVRPVRVRGGNSKFRALRLDHGNFSWGSEAVTRKTRVLDVVYNASNNELVRTQTLVKNAIVQIDAAPFKQWYQQHYGVEVGIKKKGGAAATEEAESKQSNHLKRKLKQRNNGRKLDSHLDDQFAVGRVYACISSRPGQCGRCDGYVLEGRELEFYLKKMQKKKADSWGYSLYKALLQHLKEQHADVQVIDFGVYSKYYEAAHAVGLEVEKAAIKAITAPVVRGILICGSGQGMCVIANKFRHVYACRCTSTEDAIGCRAVNDSNIITFGARTTDDVTAKTAVDAWLATKFTEGLAANLQEHVTESMSSQGIAGLDFSHTAERRLADASLPEEEENVSA